MSLFGDELRRLRRRAGLSQESLAARAGLSPEAVSLLERGRRSPRLTTMRLLAEAMDLSDVDRPALFATAQLAADVATSLPIFPDPLIGRTAEVAALAELVERSDTRLVTVLGPAGVGKTRIAVAYAAGAAPRFADGVHWLAVGTLNEPETVLTALAAALGVRSAPGSLEQIVDHLRAQASLVMIDNAEHQLAGCTEVVQALLAGAPRLKMIMISRHALGLPVEQTLAVVPLEVPVTGTAAAQLPNLPASRLFLTRAGTSDGLDEEQAAAVVRICQRVDGLPLALEIAAARTSVHTLPELADTLDAELGILQTAGPEGEVQLAEALVGWSYQWLSPQEKTIFAQLSVFRGGFGREAVAAVCGDGLGYVGSVEVLTSLVAKSLVARRDDGSPHARFRLLQLIRSFAEEQLADQPYAAETHRRHAEYFRAVVQEAAPHLTGHDQREWLGGDRPRARQHPPRHRLVDRAATRDRLPDAGGGRPVVLPPRAVRGRAPLGRRRAPGLARGADLAAGSGAAAGRHLGLLPVRLRRIHPDGRAGVRPVRPGLRRRRPGLVHLAAGGDRPRAG